MFALKIRFIQLFDKNYLAQIQVKRAPDKKFSKSFCELLITFSSDFLDIFMRAFSIMLIRIDKI